VNGCTRGGGVIANVERGAPPILPLPQPHPPNPLPHPPSPVPNPPPLWLPSLNFFHPLLRHPFTTPPLSSYSFFARIPLPPTPIPSLLLFLVRRARVSSSPARTENREFFDRVSDICGIVDGGAQVVTGVLSDRVACSEDMRYW